MLELPNERKEVRAWRIQQSFDFGGVPHLFASIWQFRSLAEAISLHPSCLHVERPSPGARGGLLAGSPDRAAGTARRDPQADTNPCQLCPRNAVVFCAELRREAKRKKDPLEGGVGGEP